MIRLPAPASRGHGRAHRLFHPLCGASLGTLVRLLARGDVAPERLHVAAIALAMAGLRLPFTLAELAAVAAMRPLLPPGPDPVFIVGHWRSGTTHLANLLSRSPVFAHLSPMQVGLPGEALGLARIARPFVEQFFPRTRLIDALALAGDLPQEDELALANLSTLSCQHGMYFPSRLQREFERGLFLDGVGAGELQRWRRSMRHYLGKMALVARGRPLLIRNPASSTRIPLLRLLWPQARFIHIHRHPAAVYASSVRMVATLMRELSLERLPAEPEAEAARLVQRIYPRLMRRLMHDVAALPDDRVVSVRHDRLHRQPLVELERIHRTLSLPGYDEAVPRFSAYLDGVADYRPHPVALAPAETAWLAETCAPILRQLDYRLPMPDERSENPPSVRSSPSTP